MLKETQPKKSVEQTFLESQGFESIRLLNAFDNGIECIHVETLKSFVSYLEIEGHIKLTGTYKP